MEKKTIGVLLLGYAVGVATGVLATKGYFKKKYNDLATAEINSVLEKVSGSEHLPYQSDPKEESDADISKKPEKKKDREPVEPKDYTKYYTPRNNVVEGNDEEGEQEETEDPDEDSLEVRINEEAAAWHKENIHREPRIISKEDAQNLPGFIDTTDLFYYVEVDGLYDEEEEEIDQPYLLIGNALDKYGFRESDEQFLYVLNYQLDTCYHIQKIEEL